MNDPSGPDPTEGTDSRRAAADGQVLGAARVADHLAIQDLAVAYAYAVDDRDWVRWQALFTPDAHIDYTAAGGIAGSPAELAAWMPGALAVFTFCLHTTATHEIRFTGPDSAVGRVHVFNRNGVEWEGESEICDVSAVYEDTYRRVGGAWRIAGRLERTLCITGGNFARMLNNMVTEG
jgi:hypothetical protein